MLGWDMAAKRISMKVEHPIEVGNVDVVFEVRDGAALLGRMEISKGGIDWYPNNARKPRTVTWASFHTYMEGNK
jgi:hypothetical protein